MGLTAVPTVNLRFFPFGTQDLHGVEQNPEQWNRKINSILTYRLELVCYSVCLFVSGLVAPKPMLGFQCVFFVIKLITLGWFFLAIKVVRFRGFSYNY